MANKFQLEPAVSNVLNEIAAKGTVTGDDVNLLKSHLYETIDDLTGKGLSDEEAFEVARLRLGNKEELSLEFQKVNGKSIVNKEWVFLLIGAGFAILTSNVLEFAKMEIAYLNSIGTVPISTATYLLTTVYILVVGLVILTFKKGDNLVIFFKTKVFDTPSIGITLFAVAVGFLTFIPLTRFLGPEVYRASGESIVRIDYFNRFTEIIFRGAIPITIGMATLLSTQSINRKLGWSTLLKSSNYLYILLLGFGLEVAAAVMGRHFFNGTWMGPIVFGAVLVLGMLSFTYHNKGESHLWWKVISFILIPLFIEVYMSIHRGNGDWASSPLFLYGIGSIVSINLGLIGSIWVFQRKNKKELQM